MSPGLDLVKGAGGAHAREKLVASLSDRCVIICVETKLVDVLHGPVPVAVVPFAAELCAGVRRTLDDNGLCIADVSWGAIEDPAAWGAQMCQRPGVVSFIGAWIERVFVAGASGVREQSPWNA